MLYTDSNRISQHFTAKPTRFRSDTAIYIPDKGVYITERNRNLLERKTPHYWAFTAKLSGYYKPIRLKSNITASPYATVILLFSEI